MTMANIGLIGIGRMGAALARALVASGGRSGFRLTCLASRRPEAASALIAQLGSEVQAVDPAEVLDHAEWVVLAVPDAAASTLCMALPWRPGHVALCTAGALDLSVLQSARSRGAAIATFHPLQAFGEGAGLSAFAGIHVGIEAQPPALDRKLAALCAQLGAQPLSLTGVDRAAYHAAAVLASNYVVALHAAAARAFELAGVAPERARQALAPLTQGAATNIAAETGAASDAQALARALTGPVARGDVASVERHLQRLSGDAELLALYRALGRQLLTLPLSISAGARAALAALFGPSG
jgi:predicted short-subunit dehydrogenase-like oxidoreductase (DUF2520 family)